MRLIEPRDVLISPPDPTVNWLTLKVISLCELIITRALMVVVPWLDVMVAGPPVKLSVAVSVGPPPLIPMVTNVGAEMLIAPPAVAMVLDVVACKLSVNGLGAGEKKDSAVPDVLLPVIVLLPESKSVIAETLPAVWLAKVIVLLAAMVIFPEAAPINAEPELPASKMRELLTVNPLLKPVTKIELAPVPETLIVPVEEPPIVKPLEPERLITPAFLVDSSVPLILKLTPLFASTVMSLLDLTVTLGSMVTLPPIDCMDTGALFMLRNVVLAPADLANTMLCPWK